MSEVSEAKSPFHLGSLEITDSEKLTRPVLQEIEINRDVARIFGLPLLHHTVSVQSKTMTFQGKLFTAAQEPIATLDEARVTVTRMTNPQTHVPFLVVSLDYFATSHGFRTGDGKLIIQSPSLTSHEPYKTPQWLYFKNQAGGVMHTWWAGNNSFELQCGWNREHQLVGYTESYFVDWFDLWEGVTHEVRGAFYRC